MSSKLRILCLHGFTSNATVHAHQLRRLTSLLPDYDFLFPDGPHKVDIASQMDMSKPFNQTWSDLVLGLDSKAGHRAWWYARDADWKTKTTGGFIGLEESLTYLDEWLKGKGVEEVHAIWGFSQGACLAGMLCALLQPKQASHLLRKFLSSSPSSDFPPPLAGVIFSGFRARFEQYDGLYEPGIDVPVLHVLGEQDPLVSSERSEALLRVCKDEAILKHPGAHDIPKGEADLKQIAEFTRKFVRRAGEGTVQASI